MADPRLRFTINIGNTRISACEWHGDNFIPWQMTNANPDDAKKFTEAVADAVTKFDSVVISGVVPAIKAPMVKYLQEHGTNVYVFRKDIIPAMEIVPDPPAKVGDDRIAVALGALTLDPKVPWITADVGTAMTCNAISPGPPARFEGGLIAPGAGISLKTLSENTAQLPELRSTTQRTMIKVDFIGHNTEEAMQWGVLIAQAASLAAMIDGQIKKLGKNTRVAMTGGGAPIVDRVMKKLALPIPSIHIDSQLLHRGLAAAWKNGVKV